MKKKIKPLVFLDAGHGGLDANGNYTTPPSMGKRFDHRDRSLNFHGIVGNSVFYEGVSNRLFANELAPMLNRMGIDTMLVADAVKDTPLSTRIATANAEHRRRGGNTAFISLHSNASSRSAAVKARGWLAFTSVGVTRADTLALNIASETLPILHELGLPARASRLLREKNFAVLARTAMPAVLIETLFFDEINDAKILNSIELVQCFCHAYAKGIAKFFQ